MARNQHSARAILAYPSVAEVADLFLRLLDSDAADVCAQFSDELYDEAALREWREHLLSWSGFRGIAFTGSALAIRRQRRNRYAVSMRLTVTSRSHRSRSLA